MIRKPAIQTQRQDAVGANLKAVMGGGFAVVRTGSYYLRGLICWGFALLWGFAALAAGVFGGDFVTFICVGTLAVVMAWFGTRMFIKAHGR